MEKVIEIIKYNEIINRKKNLISISIFKMLDVDKNFSSYLNGLKKTIEFFSLNNKFDIRIYFDDSCKDEIEKDIKDYKNVEFYKFNCKLLRKGIFHDGILGTLSCLLPLTEKLYDYIYITNIRHSIELYNDEIIEYVMQNNIDTYFDSLPNDTKLNYNNNKNNQYNIELPLLTKVKLDIKIFNDYINDIINNKYETLINKILTSKDYEYFYNYKVKYPYGMDKYFLNNIIYDQLTSETYYVNVSYDLYKMIDNIYRFNYYKIHKFNDREKSILEELKQLSFLNKTNNDKKIKAQIINLIVKFIDKYGKENLLKLFDENQQQVLNKLYKYIDKNIEKINNNTLYELNEFIRIK